MKYKVIYYCVVPQNWMEEMEMLSRAWLDIKAYESFCREIVDEEWPLSQLITQITHSKEVFVATTLMRAFWLYHGSRHDGSVVNESKELTDCATTDQLAWLLNQEAVPNSPHHLLPDSERVRERMAQQVYYLFFAGFDRLGGKEPNLAMVEAVLGYFNTFYGGIFRTEFTIPQIIRLAKKEYLQNRLRSLAISALYYAAIYDLDAYNFLHDNRLTEAVPLAWKHLKEDFDYIVEHADTDFPRPAHIPRPDRDWTLQQMLDFMEWRGTHHQSCSYLRMCLQQEEGRRRLKELGAKIE